MDASTKLDVTTLAAASGESGGGDASDSDHAGAYWISARTFASCHNCGKPVAPGDRVLRFAETGNEYCYRANCAELQWLIHVEAEDEAREREDWARRHPVRQALCVEAD